MPVRGKTYDDAQRYRHDAQLNVSHPNGYFGSFQYLLEINPGESGQATRDEGRDQADNPVLVGIQFLRFIDGIVELDENDAEDQHGQRYPLVSQELALQYQH